MSCNRERKITSHQRWSHLVMTKDVDIHHRKQLPFSFRLVCDNATTCSVIKRQIPVIYITKNLVHPHFWFPFPAASLWWLNFNPFNQRGTRIFLQSDSRHLFRPFLLCSLDDDVSKPFYFLNKEFSLKKKCNKCNS